VPKDCELWRMKYLNNVVEQDHRFVKKRVRAPQCARPDINMGLAWKSCSNLFSAKALPTTPNGQPRPTSMEYAPSTS
jgi:transposase-like protein